MSVRPAPSGAAPPSAEIHVVDRALSVQVDKVNERAANTLDAWNVQFHGAGTLRTGFRTELQRAPVCVGRVTHAERHGTRRRSVGARKALREGGAFGVNDEVDATLAVQGHILRAVPGDGRKAQPLKQGAQQLRIRCGVFDELEAVRPHGISVQVVHEFTWESSAVRPQ